MWRMEGVYTFAVAELGAAFEKIASSVPPPQAFRESGGIVMRYREKTLEQALVIKSARVISGLSAGWHLLGLGFLQEVGAIQRMLDEIDADITFLSGPLIFGIREDSHQKYLDEFFSEEFDKPGDAIGSTQKRNRVSRKTIRAYNARVMNFGEPVDKMVAVNETIEKAYSGYIHATSVHVMDMYFGDPPKWHVHGMAETFRHEDSKRDFINYIYRSVGALSFVAKGFRLDDLSIHLWQVSKKIAKATGIETWEPGSQRAAP